ncbi:MAG: bifunctional (p)ppGpp synthetase/guanosine-3',5'-bis(diphosphate) 3'-pyrophosphohydrolase [Bryobacterales bacterium]|nr:bifunctional (p)ppGpp synthetase/guanosine-3',5'-bis(diphosphate) 3'-pyrophosphohydrolase [Bryobacterales bacterium]
METNGTGTTAPLRDVLAAARFAAERHKNQRRKGESAEPYVNHLLEVADLISQATPDPDPIVLMAALLHDVVEDAGVTSAEIAEQFGDAVASMVDEVTDDKSLPKAVRKQKQVEHAPHLSAGAQLIKLADKISNLRGVMHNRPVGWDEPRCREYFEWAKRVISGMRAPNPTLLAEFEAVYSQYRREA